MDLKIGTYIKNHHEPSNEFEGQGHGSRSPRSKNVKIPNISQASGIVNGQGQRGQGQGHRGQGRSSRSQVVGKGHRAKVKGCKG